MIYELTLYCLYYSDNAIRSPKQVNMAEEKPILEMQERNVLILGRVGTGKKTLGMHIFGEDGFKREAILGANCHYKQQWVGDLLYRILTVDTESLVTGYFDPRTYIRGRFENIHLIILVTAKGRYTDENHKSLMCAVRSLDPQARSLSALIITHCEGITDESRQGIVQNFKDDPRGMKVAGFIGKGIYTVGFPDTTNMSFSNKLIYQNGIAEDENVLQRLVKDCGPSLSVHVVRPKWIRRSIESLRDGWESLCCCWESLRDCWDSLTTCWKQCCECCHSTCCRSTCCY